MRVSVATHSGQHLLLSLFLPLNINHWNRCALVFHCGFSLQFPSDKLYWASLHVFICQSYILFDEVSVQTLCVCVCVNHSIVSNLSNSLQPHWLPGSSVHGILQARILEWVAIPFFRDLLDPWNDRSPALARRFFNTWAPREALLPIFNWVYCYLNLKFYEFHMYSRYKTYSSYIICRYFLLVTYLFILLKVSYAE